MTESSVSSLLMLMVAYPISGDTPEKKETQKVDQRRKDMVKNVGSLTYSGVL